MLGLPFFFLDFRAFLVYESSRMSAEGDGRSIEIRRRSNEIFCTPFKKA